MVDVLDVVIAFEGFYEFEDFVLFFFGEFFGGVGKVVELGAFGFHFFSSMSFCM